MFAVLPVLSLARLLLCTSTTILTPLLLRGRFDRFSVILSPGAEKVKIMRSTRVINFLKECGVRRLRLGNTTRIARAGDPQEILFDLLNLKELFEVHTTESFTLGLDTTDVATLSVLAYGMRSLSVCVSLCLSLFVDNTPIHFN